MFTVRVDRLKWQVFLNHMGTLVVLEPVPTVLVTLGYLLFITLVVTIEQAELLSGKDIGG